MPTSRQASRVQAPKPRSGTPKAPGLMTVGLPRDNERPNRDGRFEPHDGSTAELCYFLSRDVALQVGGCRLRSGPSSSSITDDPFVRAYCIFQTSAFRSTCFCVAIASGTTLSLALMRLSGTKFDRSALPRDPDRGRCQPDNAPPGHDGPAPMIAHPPMRGFGWKPERPTCGAA
jgi:hypothetical protein